MEPVTGLTNHVGEKKKRGESLTSKGKKVMQFAEPSSARWSTSKTKEKSGGCVDEDLESLSILKSSGLKNSHTPFMNCLIERAAKKLGMSLVTKINPLDVESSLKTVVRRTEAGKM